MNLAGVAAAQAPLTPEAFYELVEGRRWMRSQRYPDGARCAHEAEVEVQMSPVKSRRGVLAVIACLALFLALPDTTAAQNGDLPTVSVSGGSATEGASVTFTVTLSGDSEQTATVQYATSSGTDFTAKSGTLTFLPIPGGDILTVSVQTTDDTVAEEDETFTLTLSNPTNATLGANATATATINDADEESPPLDGESWRRLGV